MRHRMARCAALLLLACRPCPGAELFYMDHDPFSDQYTGPIGPLVMSGEIVPGDYARLLKKVGEDEGRFLAQNQLLLASDGGEVNEAIRIATLVRSLHTRVIVGRMTGRCVSACFFIFAAAEQRETDGERLLGINRPFVDGSTRDSAGADSVLAEAGALQSVRTFLRENAVPDYLVEEMFRHASDDAYWLSTDDEKNLGHRPSVFERSLAARCAWDEQAEHQALTGNLSADDLKQMLNCRNRAIQADAHKALLRAIAVPVRKPDAVRRSAGQ
jgi:ATP-dependent protease ClpP protease subunit